MVIYRGSEVMEQHVVAQFGVAKCPIQLAVDLTI